MSFSQLVGNRSALERLQKMVARGQVPTSLLFSGPDGVGKLDAAMNLAKALNCARAVDGGDEAPVTYDACDECPACRRVDAGTFPDVRRIAPEGAGGQIKAEAVRQIVSESPFRPFEGRKRVYIIEAADRMNPTAANTLLKTLEESPTWIVLVLLTSHEAAILPTLLSRCQKIRFLPLLPEEVTDLLVSQHGFSAEDANLASSVSGGSLARALATKTDEIVELRGEALEDGAYTGRRPRSCRVVRTGRSACQAQVASRYRAIAGRAPPRSLLHRRRWAGFHRPFRSQRRARGPRFTRSARVLARGFRPGRTISPRSRGAVRKQKKSLSNACFWRCPGGRRAASKAKLSTGGGARDELTSTSKPAFAQ